MPRTSSDGPAESLSDLASVITPAYNCANHIESTLKSVAAQTIPPLEHIVIDDGSTDGTIELLHELQKYFPRLKIISQQNKGAGPARNEGIKAARGRYIAFLDSDDFWLPDKLEQQLRFMESNNVEFSYGDYKTADAGSGERLAEYDLPHTLTYENLLNGCPIGCLTVAYNQAALGKHYMPDIRRGQDWALWLELTRDGVVARKYPGNLAIYNHHPNSLSKNKFKKLFDVYKIYTEQEKIGALKAIWHLSRHVGYAVSKMKRHVV